MTRLHSSPQAVAFLESLKKDYPAEFQQAPASLKKELAYLDELQEIEENYIENFDPSLTSKLLGREFKKARVEEENEQVPD